MEGERSDDPSSNSYLPEKKDNLNETKVMKDSIPR